MLAYASETGRADERERDEERKRDESKERERESERKIEEGWDTAVDVITYSTLGF